MRTLYGDDETPGFASAALIYYENWRFSGITPDLYNLDAAIALEFMEICAIKGGLIGKR